MTKQRVVCDTMIWYNISTGLIPKDRYENFELISTYLNIYEILTSNHLLREPERTFKALNSLMRESNTKYLNPFQYFDEKTNERFNKNIKDVQIEFVNKLVSGALEYKMDIESNNLDTQIKNKAFTNLNLLFSQEKEEVLYTKKIIKEYRDNHSKKEVKEIVKSNAGKKAHLEAMRNDFVYLFSEGVLNDASNVDLSSFQLIINTFDTFLINLEKGACSWQQNDDEDLFNLIYVGPNDKYWTQEKKWKNIIKEAGMEAYLFEN